MCFSSHAIFSLELIPGSGIFRSYHPHCKISLVARWLETIPGLPVIARSRCSPHPNLSPAAPAHPSSVSHSVNPASSVRSALPCASKPYPGSTTTTPLFSPFPDRYLVGDTRTTSSRYVQRPLLIFHPSHLASPPITLQYSKPHLHRLARPALSTAICTPYTCPS
ncbi:hypothetical protein GQ43DRAFT_200928 [Delitschia confertaspora ATCC 74209]|uniref:Uncharacterized protein n=1 Tax=Delitschia confertaspora ATCC 74209 TaxID=1513339 RepID=A0A9P4MSG6_9PLEO|nr:hypothetical protein GQ43DRAFT_200928 [Delitschia confertaspora ATCC 74209]